MKDSWPHLRARSHLRAWRAPRPMRAEPHLRARSRLRAWRAASASPLLEAPKKRRLDLKMKLKENLI